MAVFQRIHYVINSVLAAAVVLSQIYIYGLAARGLERALGRRRARAARAGLAALVMGALFTVWRNSEGRLWLSPFPASRPLGYAAAIWVAGSCGAAFLLFVRSRLRRRRPEATAHGDGRRRFLANAVTAAAAVSPFGVAAYGTLLVRSRFQLRRQAFPVPGLPPGLEGIRIAVLSDIHFGPYLSLAELDRVIDMANETNPHLTLVTGDLITRAGDPVETCLQRLTRLRPRIGVFGCLGNHEIYAKCEDFTARRGRALGIEFLRGRSKILQFGGERLNLVGVDYQRKEKPYLPGAESLLQPGAVNLLMSHNPDVFPVAAKLGYDLVVGGHTHGGQVTVEIVEQTLNVGRFFTPFVAGLYRIGASSLYVSRGIGTINLPIRLGAEPEVSLLELRRV
jgi:predicted MPP superfamily phosphohydrolase